MRALTFGLVVAAILATTGTTAQAQKVLFTNPPGQRIPSVHGGWFVQSMSLEDTGSKRILHVSFGVAAAECAGHGPMDGPYLDIALLDAQGHQLIEATHVAALMVPDAATVGTKDIDVSSKVSPPYVSSASAITASMKADGNCH